MMTLNYLLVLKGLEGFSENEPKDCSVVISGFLLEDRNSKIDSKKRIPVTVLSLIK